MDRRAICLILGRELRDTLRDRRTLFLMVGLPIVLYPLLMIGVSQMVVAQYSAIVDEPPPIALSGAPADFVAYVEAVREEGLAVQVVVARDPSTALADGEIEVWLEFTAGGDGRDLVQVNFASARDRSKAARTRVISLLQRWRQERVEANLRSVSQDRSFVIPFDIRPEDVTDEEKKGGALFGQAVSILLVLMAITFPFYPAIDAAAGEKERGTLETLLVSPIGRHELVLGKFTAIFTVALIGSLLNLGAMLLTFGHFASLVNRAAEQQWALRGLDEDVEEVEVEGMIEKRTRIEFQASPRTVLPMMALLVPLCGMFSALSLALSSLARTYKEGQYYLTPMVAAALPLVLVTMVPEIHLTWSLAFMPVANICLLFREILAGNWLPGRFVLVLASTFAYAGMALFWARSLFDREEILFRQPGTLSWRFWRASAEYEGRPRPRHAIAVFLASLLGLWFVGVPLQQADLLRGLVVTLVVLIPGPALVVAALWRFDAREVFSLRLPSARSALGSLFLGAGGFVVGRQILHYQIQLLGKPAQGAMPDLDLPVAVAFLAFAILPAIFEEVLCRGFLLKAFLADSKPWIAILASSILFAFLHLSIDRLAFTFTLGVLLGYAVWRSRSLWTGTILHATSNGIVILAVHFGVPERFGKVLDFGVSLPWPTVAAGLALLAVGAWLVRPSAPART